jgi:uncharacterized repeat protein (TIGR02543 family)
MKKTAFLLCFIVLMTLFSCTKETITITFETNGGTPMESIVIDQIDSLMISSPIKDGYVFLGWFLNPELTESFSLKTPIEKSITLYAKWRALTTYTITYDSNGGTHISPINISEIQTTQAPNSPIKEGHLFIGWYTDEGLTSLFVFDQTITQNITLFAKWEKLSYTITFVTNGGSVIAPKTILYNDVIILSQIPTLSNQTFEGWYLDALLTIPFDMTHMPAENITLYAKWGVESFTITFDVDGGSVIDPIQLIPGAEIIIPSAPTKQGHTFAGWYLSKDDIDPYLFTVMPEYSFTLYADYATNGLLYELIDGENEYEVSLGEATELAFIQIPKRHLGFLVTQIKTSGFSVAYELEEIIIPTSVRSIKNYAFSSAQSLKQLNISKNVTFIGTSICTLCYDLLSVIVDSQNENYTSIDGILFSKDLTTLIRYPQAKTETSYLVPSFVETIDSSAFSFQQYLTNIDLGTGVKTIKDHAFYRSLIASIDIPNQVTTVELYAFRDCINLISVTIGTGLTSIAPYMFNNCTNLTEIILPPNINFIGYGAFYDCIRLSSIYVMRPLGLGLITGSLFMFTNTHSTLKIYFLDQESLNAYFIAYYWSSYKTRFLVNNPTT